jgi:ribosomal protein S18 acetylase RimI-like enzyme
MSSAILTLATPNDAPALSFFCAQQFSQAFGDGLNPQDLQLHIQKAYSIEKITAEIHNPQALFVIATDPHGLVGYGYQLWNDARPASDDQRLHQSDTAHLERFYVDQRAQGSGLASDLMTYCIDTARHKRSSGIWLTVFTGNPRAQRFYQKHGFEDVGESVFIVGNDPQIDRLYYLPLNRPLGP